MHFVFLTGASALVYEVIWQRYLTCLTGNDSLATMALILGRFSRRTFWRLRALRLVEPAGPTGRPGPDLCALLEAIIGIWGLIFPSLFAAMAFATRTWSFAPPGWLLLEGAVSTIVLIGLPAACMWAAPCRC